MDLEELRRQVEADEAKFSRGEWGGKQQRRLANFHGSQHAAAHPGDPQIQLVFIRARLLYGVHAVMTNDENLFCAGSNFNLSVDPDDIEAHYLVPPVAPPYLPWAGLAYMNYGILGLQLGYPWAVPEALQLALRYLQGYPGWHGTAAIYLALARQGEITAKVRDSLQKAADDVLERPQGGEQLREWALAYAGIPNTFRSHSAFVPLQQRRSPMARYPLSLADSIYRHQELFP